MLQYQWQYRMDGEEDWTDIEGATDPTYSFILTKDKTSMLIRLNVAELTLVDETDNAAEETEPVADAQPSAAEETIPSEEPVSDPEPVEG